MHVFMFIINLALFVTLVWRHWDLRAYEKQQTEEWFEPTRKAAMSVTPRAAKTYPKYKAPKDHGGWPG